MISQDAALAKGRRTGVFKLSGYNLKDIDCLCATEFHKIDYSFGNGDNKWWEIAAISKLDLSNNALSELDGRIAECEHINAVDLHKNLFSKFPSTLLELKALTRLNISYNNLSNITGISLEHAIDLDLSYNSVLMLDASFPHLQKIDLSHNKLDHVPHCLEDCKHLAILNLSNNLIVDCSLRLDLLKCLRFIDLSHNCIESVFSDLTYLPNLTRLDLNHNILSQIPSGQFPALTDLNLSYNRICNHSEKTVLSSTNSIKVFLIGENKLSNLPVGVLSQKELNRLDISNNSIINLPPELGLMTSIQSLHVYGNPMKIPNTLTTEKLLGWLRNKIQEESPNESNNVEIQANPKKLNYGKRNIVTISPEMLTSMPNSMDFTENQISSISVIFDFGSNLTILELGKNRLSELPNMNLPLLKYLDISCNLFVQLNFYPQQFPKLDYLNISYNRLTEIPNLEVFPLLTQFLVNNNYIQFIQCRTFLQLEFLKILDMTNNSIKAIPNELGLLPHLNFLGLSGNLFKAPSQSIISKGTSSILAYLRRSLRS